MSKKEYRKENRAVILESDSLGTKGFDVVDAIGLSVIAIMFIVVGIFIVINL